jgi:ABC-type uncharacterized transport system involved in gliding motility auxiliary subunit
VRRLLAVAMILGMALLLAFTVRATADRSILANAHLMSDVWFQVTLLDAYLGFAIFYLWVAWKEQTWPGRVLWFVLIMALGNMATTVYVLLQLRKLAPGRPVSDILSAPRPNTSTDDRTTLTAAQ